MKVLCKIAEYIAKISEVLAALLTGSIAAVLFCQVILRYVFGSGILWVDAYTRYFIIWAVMLAGNVLIYRDVLIRVDFFDSMWPEKLTKIRERIYQFLFFVLLTILIVAGWQQAWGARNTALLSLPFSQMVPYLSIPVGAALMLFQYLIKFIQTFQKSEEDASI